eukprot:m.237577 g.237577  ORF g.237577 m.237577 type:complete len:491 (+) comp19374_c0_seq1:379-1851(+)
MNLNVLQSAACGSMQSSCRLSRHLVQALQTRGKFSLREAGGSYTSSSDTTAYPTQQLPSMPHLNTSCNRVIQQHLTPPVRQYTRFKTRCTGDENADIRTGHAHGLLEEDDQWHLDLVVRYDSSKSQSPAAPSPEVRTGEDAYAIKNIPSKRNRNEDVDATSNQPDSAQTFSSHTLLAVADGVGGWQIQGVDPSLFAWELMNNCAYVAVESSTARKPLDILTRAYKKVLTDCIVEAGSSTATVSLFDKTTGVFSVANLGDSYACVIRGDDFVLETQEQQHYFNAPYQLAVIPGAKMDSAVYEMQDSPDMAASTSVATRDGDIILLATDGYSDNVFPHTTAAICSAFTTVKASSSAVPARVPQTIEKIADQLLDACLARAQSSNADTPFARHAAEAGLSYTGGKPDDVTFIVARVRAPRLQAADNHDKRTNKNVTSDAMRTTTTTDASGSILARDPTKRRFTNDMPLLCDAATGAGATSTPAPLLLVPLAHL